MSSIETVVLAKLDAVYKQAITATDFTAATGNELLSYFLLFVIVWKGIEFAMVDQDKGEVVFGFLKLLFFWGILKWLLKDYDVLMGDFLKGFDTIFADIKREMGFAAPAGASFTAQTEVLLKLIEKVVDTLVRMDGVGGLVVPDVALAISYLGQGIVLVFALALMYLGFAVYTGVYLFMTIIVKVYILIGVIMGPFMIPFLMFGFLSWIGDGWIRFMITAGFMSLLLKVFGVLIDAIGSAYIESIIQRIEGVIKRAGSARTSDWTSATAAKISDALVLMDFVLMLIMYLILAYLLLQIPTITEMLLSGRGLGSGVSGASRSALNAGGKATGWLANKVGGGFSKKQRGVK